MSDLRKLIDIVKSGGPNENDGTLYRLFGENWVHAWDIIDCGSLDAAKALHEALLPGWHVSLSQPENFAKGSAFRVSVQCPDPTKREHVMRPTAEASDPARAWLIAILRAYEATNAETN